MRSFLLLFLILLSLNLQAQKFGYIDSNFIIAKMPGFQDVQTELDKISTQWQGQIDKKWEEVNSLRQKYLNEEILLTDEMKEERLEEIQNLEKEAREYQQNIFGYQGLYFQKQQELLQPIRDELYEAVQKVSRRNRLQIMFDKSSDLIMIYTEPRHDYTDYVLEELGLKEKEEDK